ncbi:MAG: ABC transporter permease [Alphaproteobacteria bacterium]|nr:ABC transporter permease [Alphaproteobacteria bacterium]
MSIATTDSAPARPGVIGWIIGLARRSPTFALGFAIVLVFAVLALGADWLAPFDPVQTFPFAVLKPPGGDFVLGSDGNGMDVLSRVIHGSRYAFGISLPAGALMVVIGVPLGVVAGYKGGVTDEVLIRILDVLRAFPTIILSLAVVAAAGASLLNVVLVIGFLDSPIFARIVRAEVLALRSATFVRAAVAVGNPPWRVMFVHILPNAIMGAIAQLPVRMSWAVRISATLAFVGVGVQAPAPEWGAMIRQGAEFVISGEWWVATFPGLALIALVLGFNLLGDGLQDLLDPRRRATGK